MIHLAMIIDKKEKFDDEMSEVSSILLSESHRDNEWELLEIDIERVIW